jgi:hypothetical protein
MGADQLQSSLQLRGSWKVWKCRDWARRSLTELGDQRLWAFQRWLGPLVGNPGAKYHTILFVFKFICSQLQSRFRFLYDARISDLLKSLCEERRTETA